MGGWHAFPGGGLARTDAEIPIGGHAAPGRRQRPRRRPARRPARRGRRGGARPDARPRRLRRARAVRGDRPAARRPAARRRRSRRASARPCSPARPTSPRCCAGLDATPDASAPGLCRPLDDPALRAGALRQPLLPARVAGRADRVQPAVLPGELGRRRVDRARPRPGEPGSGARCWPRRPSSTSSRCSPRTARRPACRACSTRAETNLGPLRRVEMRPGVLMFPLPHPHPAAGRDHQRLSAGLPATRCWSIPARRTTTRSTAWSAPSRRRAERLGRRVTADLAHPPPPGPRGRRRPRCAERAGGAGPRPPRAPPSGWRGARIQVDGQLEDGAAGGAGRRSAVPGPRRPHPRPRPRPPLLPRRGRAARCSRATWSPGSARSSSIRPKGTWTTTWPRSAS